MSQSVFNSILFSRRSPLFQLHSFVIFCFVRWQPCTVVGNLSRFFTDSFSQHKKVRQVAICFILTSFNFNCFKNHCFWFYIVAWKKKLLSIQTMVPWLTRKYNNLFLFVNPLLNKATFCQILTYALKLETRKVRSVCKNPRKDQ